MAKVGNNILTHGLQGMVGDLIVFRQRDGKTIVSAKPEHHGSLTEAQLQHLHHFQEAVIYAKSVLSDPEKKEAYKHAAKPGQSAYNVALADFLKAPHIEEIDIAGYDGKPGSKIRVRAVDDFKITAVTLEIHNSDGAVLEQGNAVCDANGLDWIYTATKINDPLTGGKITVKVSDNPGHLVESSKLA